MHIHNIVIVRSRVPSRRFPFTERVPQSRVQSKLEVVMSPDSQRMFSLRERYDTGWCGETVIGK